MELPLALWAEALVRIALGLRFLSSGLSNLRRWPNPVRNARIAFPAFREDAQRFLGAAAVALMILGGLGLVLGFLTRLSALAIVVFLLPTFKIHRHWLRQLPAMKEAVEAALAGNRGAFESFQVIGRQAYHSHETGWKENLLLALLALFFMARGSAAFGLDHLF
jgi:uncharacterized membrane protein YphA (DoxX/SURF4 family)